MQQVQPIFDRILVRRAELPEKTKTGLFIPQDARAVSQLGEVVSVGTGRNIDAPGGYSIVSSDEKDLRYLVRVLRPAMVVKVGDQVLFGKFAGAEVELNGETLFILREDEILAIVTGVADEAERDVQEPIGMPA